MKKINGYTRERFIEFLESTLIPDLYESGTEFTAKDFETAVAFMRDEDKEGEAHATERRVSAIH